jgi:tryptophan 7-halogenase
MQHIETVVIVGGGTAGWMAAAALATVLKQRYKIELVESEEIGTVGVGEATIPMIQRFNRIVGIDENEFVKATHGSFKLGIEFVNWGAVGDRYTHGFGRIGQDLWTVPFDQYWQKMARVGLARPLEQYSIARMAAKANKFMPPPTDIANSPLNEIAYAYHFDAGLYAKFLRGIAEQRGVRRHEGKVNKVNKNTISGHIESVQIDNGAIIAGQFFIDCSGFRGLLIEQELHAGYEDWSHWMPCDRALAVPCTSVTPLTPYTRSTAHSAGWQWRIPLQHRTGNGHVYCSQFVSDEQAERTLLEHLDGKPLADPRQLRFVTGMRKQSWKNNVVAIGLASGFLEPLESTSIHLIQSAISRVIDFFPSAGINEVDVAEYNRQSRFEIERIRDFVILHYKLTQRTDSEFWKQCAAMSIPDSLQHKIDLYEATGRLVRIDNELFAEVGWLQVMQGQNLLAKEYHPLVDVISENEIHEYLESVREVIDKCVNFMPTHADYIAKHCAAKAGMAA